jgi:hypothetical protein
MSKRPAMSRAVRTARGVFGALTATALAAASHAVAGGAVTPLAVVATALFALPLCVLLAGRTGSLWRLTLAVAGAQFVYHWSFSGLGIASSASVTAPASLHAAHLGVFSPALSGLASASDSVTMTSAADAWMWAAHALAAFLTIARMHRGERAIMRLVRVLREAVPVRVPVPVRLPARPAILVFSSVLPSRAQPVFLSAITHRGPPATPAFAH